MHLFGRIFFYSIGLFLGSLLVFFLFKERSWTYEYFPQKRVLGHLHKKKWHFSDKFLDQINKNEIDTVYLQTHFLDFNVDFNKSKPREKPCGTYKISFYLLKNRYEIWVKNCDKLVIFTKFIGFSD